LDGATDSRASDATDGARDAGAVDLEMDGGLVMATDAGADVGAIDVASEAPNGAGDAPREVGAAADASDAATTTDASDRDGGDGAVSDGSVGGATGADAPSSDGNQPPYDGSGALAWVQRSQGNGSDQAGGMTITTSGAYVVSGQFNGTIKFAPSSASPPSFNSLPGGQSLYLARYKTDGTLDWVRTAGTSVQNGISAVGAAPNDDIFVGGSTYASTTDPLVLGAGEANQTTFKGIGTFFGRYHADGTLAWAKLEKNGGGAFRVMPAPDGGMFAMGSMGSAYATFGVGEPNQTDLIYRAVNVSTPTYLARFGADGHLAWVRTMGFTDPDAALMADGGVVLVGLIGPMMGVLQGGAQPDLTLSTDLYDTVVASYSGAGDLRWAKQIKGLPQANPSGVAVLASGDIVVSGTLEPDNDGTPAQGDAAHTQAVFGPGEANETRISCSNFDLYLARYATDGTLAWAKSVPTASPALRGLAPLADGGFVMTSTFQNAASEVVFDPGIPGSISVMRIAQYGDTVVSWHRPDGTARAARTFATGAPFLLNLSVAADGGVLISGGFSGTTIFGPLDAAAISYTKTGGGYQNYVGEDMFLARLNP
jgi:hypothetical protein